MRTVIDAAGRIVVPKALRDALGLSAGQEIDIELVGGLEIEPAPTDVALHERGKGVVAVPDREQPPLTADDVRRTLERARAAEAFPPRRTAPC